MYHVRKSLDLKKTLLSCLLKKQYWWKMTFKFKALDERVLLLIWNDIFVSFMSWLHKCSSIFVATFWFKIQYYVAVVFYEKCLRDACGDASETRKGLLLPMGLSFGAECFVSCWTSQEQRFCKEFGLILAVSFVPICPFMSS